MRCARVAVLIVVNATLLSACTPRPTATTDSPAISNDQSELAKQGGCIGKPLDTCLTNLQMGFQFGPYQNIDEDIRRNEAVDVTGKRVAKKNNLMIFGTLKGLDSTMRSQGVNLTYTQDKIVDYVEISLPSDPSMANTEDEYRKTGLYEGMVLLLGSSCSTIDRADVYKFFQTTVKPKIVREGKHIEINDTNAEVSHFAKALNIPFCGQKFSYTNLFGVDTDDISATNPHGVYMRTSISFGGSPAPRPR
jgi:hypothetical protein